MKKLQIIGLLMACVVLGAGLMIQLPALSQSSLTWEGILPAIFTGTSGTESINISFSQTDDITVNDDLTVGGWLTIPPTIVDATPYTISATGKSSVYIVEYTDTGAASIVLPDVPADGTMITIQDGDLNAGTNNITIGTAGSDTINESTTFVQNANGESTQLIYSTINADWAILGGYAE